MREQCWMYQPYGLLTTFLILWLLLFLFLAFRIKGRVILLGLVLLVAIFWVNVQRSEVPAAEAGAVGRLRQLNAAMEDYKSQHQSYPERLPDVPSRWVIDKYYRFDLVSSRSADGKVVDYLIQGTPRHLPCLMTRSFAMTRDGHFF